MLLVGGTHGDEPAGAEAVVRFLEGRRWARWPRVAFTAVPCLNPWGYANGRREGPGGVDLNRAFRRATRATPEVTLLKRALGRRRFDLLVDCHEDCDAPGAYVLAPFALGRAVLAAMARVGPLHPGPAVDGTLPLDGGLVALDLRRAAGLRRTVRRWLLPFYVAHRHRLRSRQQCRRRLAAGARAGELPWVTVETPSRLPLAVRVAMQLAALDAAVDALARRFPHRPRRTAVRQPAAERSARL